VSVLRPLDELLLRWEDARQQGNHLSAEMLCADCPQLVDELRSHIRAIQAMEEALGVGVVDPEKTLTATRMNVPLGAPELPQVDGYEVVRVLEQGGMGIVYEARQKALGRRVALKMISGPMLSARQLGRFRTEVESAAHLQHPNIVQIFEVGQASGRPFFSMEFIDGGSLASAMASRIWRTPTLEGPQSAAEMLATIARAVHYAHERGIVHRDLKPSNVLLTKDGVPKIADFGLAKRLNEDSGHTETGEVLGTPNYMAPEQAEGKKDLVGPRTDVYSLGAILYELLTGQPPFRSDNVLHALRLLTSQEPVAPSRLAPTVPRDLEAICLKCLEKTPAQRYGSAQELADDIERFLQGRPVVARRLGPIGRMWKWCKRHPQRAAAMLLAVSAAAAAITYALDLYFAEQRLKVRAAELAPQVREILHRNCFECHGQDTDNISKKLNVLDHRSLLESERRIVVAGTPDSSRLIQRIADGSMPPEEDEVRLPRLTQLELNILSTWIRGGAPPFPTRDSEEPPPPVVPFSQLAAEAKQVFTSHCYRCHKYDVARGGIKILHHRLLLDVRKVVVPGDPEASELYHLLTSSEGGLRMPPPPAPKLAASEVDIVRRWILAGAPPFPKGD